MIYKVLTLEEKDQWNNYLRKLPQSQQDIYYTPEYYSLYQNYSDGQAICFVFEKDGHIALYPFLLNSVNELGYDLDDQYYDIQGAYGYNGVITSSYNREFISDFYFSFKEYIIQNHIIAEFTRFNPLLKNYIFSEGFIDVEFDRKTIYIDLIKDYEALFKGFQRTTKKQIRRAQERYGLVLKLFNNDSNIADDFYSIYKETMQKVNAIEYLYFNKSYFGDLLDIDGARCFMAYSSGKPISSIITLQYGKYLHGHLGGTRTPFLTMSPFSFLYDEIIKYGKKENCECFHIGGGSGKSNEDAVLKYKLHFSNNVLNFHIGKKIHKPQIYNEIIKQWCKKNPAKKKKYKNVLLKYRY